MEKTTGEKEQTLQESPRRIMQKRIDFYYPLWENLHKQLKNEEQIKNNFKIQ